MAPLDCEDQWGFVGLHGWGSCLEWGSLDLLGGCGVLWADSLVLVLDSFHGEDSLVLLWDSWLSGGSGDPWVGSWGHGQGCVVPLQDFGRGSDRP